MYAIFYIIHYAAVFIFAECDLMLKFKTRHLEYFGFFFL